LQGAGVDRELDVAPGAHRIARDLPVRADGAGLVVNDERPARRRPARGVQPVDRAAERQRPAVVQGERHDRPGVGIIGRPEALLELVRQQAILVAPGLLFLQQLVQIDEDGRAGVLPG